MAQRVTITDVARAAGVSVATVSKVINNRYDVARATAARVRQAIEELGYESSLVASSLRSRRTNVIGILVAEFEPFSTEILKGVSSSLQGSGYELLAYAGALHRAGSGWERRSLSRLSGTLIDGAILATPTVVITKPDIPIVAVDPHTGSAEMPTVEADSFAGAVQAVQHLIELGHRRIGYLAGRPDLKSSVERQDGYQHALAEAGIAFDPSLIRVGDYHAESVASAAASLLTAPQRPTAVFAANDASAIGVLRVAQRLGIDVPRELSIVGFDDIPESARITPPLTTIRQPIQQMGTVAAELLLRLLRGESPEATHLVFPTTLVPRASTAPGPSRSPSSRRANKRPGHRLG